MSSSKIALFLTTEAHPALTEALQQDYQVLSVDDDAKTARAVVTTASLGISNELLDRLPNAEILAVFGVGLDGIDQEYVKKRGLTLTNTPGVLDEAVAEHALALLLCASRRLIIADSFVREGEWERGPFPLAKGLSGKRCGIVGLGRIGRRIARLCQAFGMQIAYHGRHKQDSVGYEYFEDLWALANESDVLILALPGGDETNGIVTTEVIRALGPEGLLVNVARGSVVDEQALIEALEYGDLGAAALDVFEDEPHPPEELFSFPNVVLTPHLGSATEESRQAMVDLTLENLKAYFKGETPPGLVSAE